MRKGKQSKKAMADKEEHQREEMRFNLTYPFRDTRSGASARRRQEGLREDGGEINNIFEVAVKCLNLSARFFRLSTASSL